MKTFKISKKSNQITKTVPLNFGSNSLSLSGDNICLALSKEEAYGLCEGGKLHLAKYANGNTGQSIKVCEKDAIINKIIEVEDVTYVYFEYTYIEPLTVTSFLNITSSSGYRYKIYFATQTNIAPGDFEKYKRVTGTDYAAYVRTGSGDILKFTDLALCYPYELVKGETVRTPDGDCCKGEDKLFNYETMEKNSILAKKSGVTAGSKFVPSGGDEVLLSTNPYYFTNGGTIVLFDGVVIEKYTDYFGLGVVLEQDYDAKRMFQEYQVNELFVKKIKNSVVPGFIDLEKIKYAPAFYTSQNNQESVLLATGLTFNLHFRSREQDINGPDQTDKYKFKKTWYLNDATDTWNGNGFTGQDGSLDVVSQDNLYDNEDFVNSSNLIGYLDFTDDDIYNQKNRVKQSFLRLSFYDDKNPLTQSLLYYSTIFMDSGELYGKYVKRKAALEDNDTEYDSALNPIVWSPVSSADTVSAVTSQFTVNDEYDMTKSGEGFNLYLFRQDAPLENYPQDIYMKVEFNHAGNGRIVPLIFWPKSGTKPKDLANYIDSLYIRVLIALTERGYVYSFPDIEEVLENNPLTRRNGILWENDRIVFNLFEPRILPDDFD